MERTVGTVVRGVRAPIFREGDDVVALTAAKKERGNGLYAADASALFKRAEKNPVVTAMLSDFGPQWCHDHLHVHYGHRDR